MSTSEPTTVNEPSYAQQAVIESVDPQVSKVWVVDDAYDVPSLEDAYPTKDSKDALMLAMQESDGIKSFLAQASIAMPEDLTESNFGELWQLQGASAELRIAFESVAASVPLPDITALPVLVNELRKVFGSKVVEIGRKAFLDRLGEVRTNGSLVFLDYLLEFPEVGTPGQITPADTKASGEILRSLFAINREEPTAVAPFVFMMSSRPPSIDDRERYRRDWKAMRGLFRFESKEAISDRLRLHLRLSGVAHAMKAGQSIHRFTSAVASAASETVQSLEARLREFSLVDYAYCLRLSLASDGEPLGAYMLWLVDALRARDLRNDAGVKASLSEVDALLMQSFPSPDEEPSTAFLRAYESAMMELPTDPEHGGVAGGTPGGERAVTSTGDGETSVERGEPTSNAKLTLPEHPAIGSAVLKREGLAEASQTDKPKLGNIYSNSVSGGAPPQQVWMVITPECDLQDGPKRPLAGSAILTMIPGRVSAISHVVENLPTSRHTEIVLFADRPYRIDWIPGKVQSFEFKDWDAWLEKEGCRKAPLRRLRASFAYDVQHGYAAHIARIGIPVKPPLSRTVSASLVTLDADGRRIVVHSWTQGVVMHKTSRDVHLTLSDAVIKDFYEQIVKSIELTKRYVAKAAIDKKFEVVANESGSEALARARKALDAGDAHKRSKPFPDALKKAAANWKVIEALRQGITLGDWPPKKFFCAKGELSNLLCISDSPGSAVYEGIRPFCLVLPARPFETE